MRCTHAGLEKNLTKVSNKAGRGYGGGPLAVKDRAIRLDIQTKAVVAFRELFEAAFSLVDGVVPFLVLSVSGRRMTNMSVLQSKRCRGGPTRVETYLALRPSWKGSSHGSIAITPVPSAADETSHQSVPGRLLQRFSTRKPALGF